MGTVYITCPTTQQPVNTGIHLTEEAFQTWSYSGVGAPCPHCGEIHPWSKDTARLERSQDR